jgi:hypothetical protein
VLFAEDTEQAFLELPDSEPNDHSSNDDSRGTDNLALGEVIALECTDNKADVVQGAAAPSAQSATFMWEDMKNYVRQREQFFGNHGPQNKPQNETHCAKVFRMFFY